MHSQTHRLASRAFPLTLLLMLFVSSLFGDRPAWLPFAEFEFESEAEEEHDGAPGADEMYYEMRAYPLKTIPLGARLHALEQLELNETRQLQARERLYGKRGVQVIEQSQPQWEAVGPQPISNVNSGTVSRAASGRATAVALHPDYDGVNNQTVYIGAAQGGVWKSTNNGLNWVPLIDDQPSLAVGALAIDPVNPQVLYVGTGEGNNSGDSYYGAGLLKSLDGGLSWRVIPGPLSTLTPRTPVFQKLAIMQLAIDPKNTQTIYLCTRGAANLGGGLASVAPGDRGVWKSTDGGETWRNLQVPGANIAYSASEVLLSPADSNTVFAGVLNRGIYRSTQGGEPGTWQLLAGGLPASDIARIEMVAGPPLPPSILPTLFAVIANASSNLNGIFRSTDNGTTWTKLNDPSSVGQTTYNLALDVDAKDPNIIYLGMVRFYRSINGGQTWSDQTTIDPAVGVHVDHHFALVSKNKPNVFFIANDGGIYRSDNANDTSANMRWNNLNDTLNTIQFTGVAIHPTDPNFLLGGTQDNGSNRFTGNKAWTNVAGGDGGYSLVDFSQPNIVWHSFQNSSGSATAGASFGPRISLNGGSNWTDRGCRASCRPVPGMMNPSDRVRFYSPIAQHTGFATPGNVVYWGTHRVYRTADLGVTWTGLGPSTDGFGQDVTKGAGMVTVMAAHPKLDTSTTPPGEIVWAGTSDGNLQVTTNAGKLGEATFTNVVKAPLPNRFVTDIALDSENTRRAFVAYSGFNVGTPATPGHVFATDDLGQTWRDISGDLPDVPVTSITLDPKNPGTLFIGTDIGVFQTTDGGATWVRLGNGMPRVATYMIRFQAATRTLFAATHGRGIYRLKLAAPVVSVSSANFARNSLAVEGIASAFGVNLATRTEVASSVPLPTTLAGTTVRITDANGLERLAPLFFVSAQQINYQIPPDIAPGAITVTITSGDGSVSFGIERANIVAPSFFTANASGRGVPAGVAVRVSGDVQTFFVIARLDNSTNPPQFVPEAIDLGVASDQVVLVLFGTGLRRRPDLSGVDVMIGGVRVPADYAGQTPGFVGLDQLNFRLPRALVGRGEVDVTVNTSGAVANTVRVSIK